MQLVVALGYCNVRLLLHHHHFRSMGFSVHPCCSKRCQACEQGNATQSMLQQQQTTSPVTQTRLAAHNQVFINALCRNARANLALLCIAALQHKLQDCQDITTKQQSNKYKTVPTLFRYKVFLSLRSSALRCSSALIA